MSTDGERAEGPEQESGAENTGYEDSHPFVAGGAKHANKAINQTFQKYLAAIGLDLDDVQERIREEPILCMAISAAIGFVAGGGMTSKLGLMLLGLAGRRAATETAANFGHQVLRQAAGNARASA